MEKLSESVKSFGEACVKIGEAVATVESAIAPFIEAWEEAEKKRIYRKVLLLKLFTLGHTYAENKRWNKL